MSATNRFVNRLLVFVVGLVTLAIGLALIAIMTVPVVRDSWETSAPDVAQSVSAFADRFAITIGPLALDGVAVLSLVAILVMIVLLLVFAVRHGGGHTRAVVDVAPSGKGRTVVESGFASDLVSAELDRHPEFISTRVSAYSVKSTPTLLVSATTRRGVSPAAAIAIIERAALSLDEVLGARLPVVVRLSGGFRSRVSRGQRIE